MSDETKENRIPKIFFVFYRFVLTTLVEAKRLGYQGGFLDFNDNLVRILYH